MTATVLVNSFWADKALYDDAEKKYYENLAKLQKPNQEIKYDVQSVKSVKRGKNKKAKVVPEVVMETIDATYNGNGGRENKDKRSNVKNTSKTICNGSGGGAAPEQKWTLASEVAKAREHIKTSLESIGSVGLSGKPSPAAVENVCRSGQCGANALADALKAIQGQLDSLQKRVAALEIKCTSCPSPKPEPAPTKLDTPTKKNDDGDDDVDLFGSDSEEDEEAEKLKEQRVAEYAAKKSKKPALIAKSSIILDVKPWDDETDMKQLEAGVRAIEMDGLLWGASKLVPLAYGIHKLQITCVVEDEKVSVDLLTEQIEGIEDLVQSVDIAAFNKI